MNKNIQMLTGGRIIKPWTQPSVTSNTSYGTITANSEFSASLAAWKAADGDMATDWITANGVAVGTWNWALPVNLLIESVEVNQFNSGGGRSLQVAVYTNSSKNVQIGVAQSYPDQTAQASLLYLPSKEIITNNIFVDIPTAFASSAYVGLCRVLIKAKEIIGG